MDMEGVDISSDTEDTWIALALGEVAGARVNIQPGWKINVWWSYESNLFCYSYCFNRWEQ